MLNAAIISWGDDVGPQSDITMLHRFAYMMTDHVWCCQIADGCEVEERRWGLVLPALVNWDSSQIYSSPKSWRWFLAKYFHCNTSCVTFQTTIPQCTEYFAPRNWVQHSKSIVDCRDKLIWAQMDTKKGEETVFFF